VEYVKIWLPAVDQQTRTISKSHASSFTVQVLTSAIAKSSHSVCCRSADQNQPRETMEQHLLAYLTNKYGVRQLITQWLTSILAAIEHFSPLDAQTALFGKVLRNEVEEEFEEAQLRVKTTASSLLQSILQVILGCRVTIHQMCMLALASLWSHRIGKGCQIIQSNLACHSKGDLQL